MENRMSENSPLTFALTQDKKALIVTPRSAEPFAIDALSTEGLIHVLIDTRAAMEPRRVSSDPFAGTPMISHPEMRWYVAPAPDSSGRVQLSLAHPGLGWIGITLQREMATKLMNHLQDFLK
jgi:hypothetical protein